ncbi:hypothetical protein ALO36_104342 [Pseudomonas syringae pv. tomato]|uniref:Uncharacterized protein n=1 Tax=Pseudomonas syringae pv. maculicola TaxID=59511 RepID=A0A3M3AGH5_PSEYM|nr:hypothetical protein WX98_17700 [Pseudomonas syringae pv. persicae]KPY93923.1 hypothetical protein ALO36_104342 [Pseudomonas syringae pv. tomato]RML99589.1 hypothetical protein APX70_01962 [Pseudomonas syringae pv. maculicola]
MIKFLIADEKIRLNGGFSDRGMAHIDSMKMTFAVHWKRSKAYPTGAILGRGQGNRGSSRTL